MVENGSKEELIHIVDEWNMKCVSGESFVPFKKPLGKQLNC